MLAQPPNHLHLLFWGQSRDASLYDTSDGSLVNSDEAGKTVSIKKCAERLYDSLPLVVNKGEEAHDELAVHAVSHATVAGNRIAKVLDVECSLESGSKETTKWSNERSKGRENQDVELHRTIKIRVSVGAKDCSRFSLRYAHSGG